MPTHKDTSPVSETSNTGTAAAQTFQGWATRRLELYREIEQQVQTSIAHSLQLASEFTVQMEQETERLLAYYQREREEHLQQIEQLSQQLQNLRATIEQGQQSHQETLRQERAQHDRELNQERVRAMQTIERQMAEANTQRERMLRDAYTERDRVVEETRLLSARLHTLQQSLQGLLGSVAPPPPADSPSTSTIATMPPAPPQRPAPPAPPPDPQPYTTLEIHDVPGIEQASEIMDRCEQHHQIDTMELVSYEQGVLLLKLHHASDMMLASLLHEEFADLVEIVRTNENGAQTIWLRSIVSGN